MSTGTWLIHEYLIDTWVLDRHRWELLRIVSTWSTYVSIWSIQMSTQLIDISIWWICQHLINTDENCFTDIYRSTWSTHIRVLDRREHLIDTDENCFFNIYESIWLIDMITWLIDVSTWLIHEYLIDTDESCFYDRIVSTWLIQTRILDQYRWEYLIDIFASASSIHMWVQNMRWRDIFQTVEISL